MLRSQVSYVRDFLQIIGLLALLIGGVGIINTMQVLLRRRRIEIAMLKTEGYRQSDLYSLFGLEAALLGLIGGVVGSAAGGRRQLRRQDHRREHRTAASGPTVDPLTVASGVAIGFVTALIFGILPIVQSSQVRPQSVLRELPEGSTASSVLLTIVLVALLGALFFVLSAVILGNIGLALIIVMIGGVVLADPEWGLYPGGVPGEPAAGS